MKTSRGAEIAGRSAGKTSTFHFGTTPVNRTRHRFWFAALAVVALAVGATEAIAADRHILGETQGIPLAAKADPDSVRTLTALREKAKKDGAVRLIIGVRAAFAPERSMDTDGVAQQRNDIANMQSAVLNKVTSLKLKPKKTKPFRPFHSWPLRPIPPNWNNWPI
ncbi:MAG TPA: hypothetical protein VMT34_00105 [Aggregatilineales bacterium]|jgi:hypothetical protein|nr:hypothetical protein [Aggregatilineales bacterium]